jgi:hypothetical protein
MLSIEGDPTNGVAARTGVVVLDIGSAALGFGNHGGNRAPVVLHEPIDRAPSHLDYAHVTQSGFFITVNGTVDTAVIYCGDRWSSNTNNGIGYNRWRPFTIRSVTAKNIGEN